MSQAIRNGEAVWSALAGGAAPTASRARRRAVRFQSLAVVPLSVGARPFGAVSLSFVARRDFDPEERSLPARRRPAGRLRARAGAPATRPSESLNERLAFLAEASELLAGSLDPDTR